jgi:DHA1 family multidrug resistance protein-like MFS transporter/DHA1 family quinolone resistance protein-like MFS transporter
MADDTTRPAGSRKLAIIGPLAFFMAVGQGSMALGLVFHARDALGASKAQTGLLAGIWPLFYMLSCHLSRPLNRRLRPRYCVLGATLTLSTFALLIAQAQSLPLTFALNAALGATTALFWPPMMGWLAANAEGHQLNRRLAVFNLCWSAGAIVSPTLAGWASEVASRLPLLISASLFLLDAVLITTAIQLLPGIGSDDDAHERERDPGTAVADGTPLRYPAWLGIFATYLVLGVLLSVFPMAARTELGLRNSQVGTLLFLRALATSLSFLALGRMRWWHFRGWQMVAGTLCLGTTLLWLAGAQRMGMVAGTLVFGGVFTALGYVNSLFHGAAGSSHRVARMAIHESLLSAGLCVGASLGGIVYQQTNMAGLLTGLAALLGVTSAIQFVLVRTGRSSVPAIGEI